MISVSIYSRVNTFIKRYTNKIPTYKDGFFEIPFVANSPQMMVNSLGKLFMNKLDEKNQVITSNTPFADGTFHYFKLDEHCWLMAIDVMFKRSMRYKKMHLPEKVSDFYTFSFSKFIRQLPRMPKFNDQLLYSNDYYVITRPGENIEASYMKGTHGLYINLMVTPEWFRENSRQQKFKSTAIIEEFMKEGKPYFSWPLFQEDDISFHEQIWKMAQNKKLVDEEYIQKLRQVVYKMLDQVQISINRHDKAILHSDLNGEDRKKILLAERFLMKHLYNTFPGVDSTSKEVAMSPTKLKICFKQIYGKTLFDYYQHHKMNTAKLMLASNKFQIREVAHKVGYETANKFTAAFKKQFGTLPSDHVNN